MKKLLLILMALFLWAGSSWGQYIIIGSSALNTNGSTFDPVERYYNYEHYQIIYTAAELSAAGMPAGAVITALGFSITESAASLANYTISMGLTPQAIAQPYIATLSPVKTAFTYVPVVQALGSFDMIPFDFTFTWNGTSNIVVNTCTGSNPFTSPYGGLRYTAMTSGMITYVRTDGSSNCASTSLTSTTYRPDIRFNYTGGSNCSGTPAPGNTISSANPVCPSASFTLSLQNSTPGSGVSYVWQTSFTGSDPWASVGSSAPSYSTTQTTATYYRCQVTCSGNTGISTPVHVTMNPFSNCYCLSSATSNADEEVLNVTVGTINNSSTCTTLAPGVGSVMNMYSNYFDDVASTVLPRATSPSFSVQIGTCGGNYSNAIAIFIDYNQDGIFGAGEQVFVSPTYTAGPHFETGIFTVPVTATLGCTRMRVVNVETTLPSGILACGTYSWGETEDYKVCITEAPPCPPPTALTATSITGTSANLSWTPTGVETSWEYVYGVSPLPAPSGSGTATSSSTVNPISPLLPQTVYQYYVRAECNTKAASPWSGPFTFTTLCATTVAPWCEPFQNQVIPLCWTMSGPQAWVFTNTWPNYGAQGVADHTGTGGSFAGVDGSGTAGLTGITLTSPLLNKSLMPSAQLHFWVFNNNISSTLLTDEQELIVHVLDGTSHTVYTWAYGKNNAAWEEVIIPLTAYASPLQLQFVVNKGVNLPFYDDMIIDDICIEEIPPCQAPTVLTAVPAAFQAVIGWTEMGSATTWDIEYGAVPYTYTGTATISGVSNPYTLGSVTALLPSTGYTYKVRSNCTAKAFSPWSGAKTFTTTVACPAPTALNVSGVTMTSAYLGWTENGSATSWDVELRTTGSTFTGTPTESGVTNPYDYLGLISATSYTYYVRAVCGGASGNSLWAGPYTFSTSCALMTLPYCQEFTTSSFPPCWSQTYSGGTTSDRWSMSNTNLAGGVAYEAMCTYQSAIGVTSLICPQINTAGHSIVHLAYRQMVNDYNAGINDVNYYLKSRFDGGAWVTQWSHAGGIGASIPAELKELDIPVTGNKMELAWVVDGNLYDINYWYIDNVCVTVPLLLDAKTVSIDNVPALTTPGTVITPKATVKNVGSTSPVTFNVTMTATGGYSSTVTGVTLASGVQTQVTFADWTPALGDYTVTVCTQLVGDLDPSNDCKTELVSIQALRKVYAYVAYDATLSLPEGPAYFYVQSPGTITSLAATTSAQFISAGTWADGVWYGSEYYDNVTTFTGGGWWTINPATGAMTMIANFSKGFTGISYNKNTGIMYGTDWDGTTNNLYTIDRFTGVSTLIGSYGTGELMINLASDGSDYLYAIGISTDVLFKIDPTVPSAVAVGPTGFAFNYGQDMEYDYDNNIMYVCGYTTTGQFMTANLTTGACTLIANFQGGAEITGFAIPYSTDKTLNLTSVFLESLYWDNHLVDPDWAPGKMTRAADENGFHWTNPVVADQITVELHNATTYATVEYSAPAVNLSTTGTATVTVPGDKNGFYYITIKHRNSIETTSALPQDFSGASISYAFDTQSKAYGLDAIGTPGIGIMIDGTPVIYAGDENQDSLVDGTDLQDIGNLADYAGYGYIPQDINGDGLIDGSDLQAAGNNSDYAIGAILP